MRLQVGNEIRLERAKPLILMTDPFEIALGPGSGVPVGPGAPGATGSPGAPGGGSAPGGSAGSGAAAGAGNGAAGSGAAGGEAGAEGEGEGAGGGDAATDGDDDSSSGAAAAIAIAILEGPPIIVTQPVAQDIIVNDDAVFSVTAIGKSPLSYAWQISPLSPISWSPLVNGPGVAGADTANLTLLNVPLDLSGSKVRCIVGNTEGTATSHSASLFVAEHPSGSPWIIADPESAGVSDGNPVSFLVVAGGTAPLSYQWQRSIDGGASYSNLADGGIYSGATTDTLTVNPAGFAQDGYRFRCHVSNAISPAATSNGAVLTVADPVITSQPVSQGSIVIPFPPVLFSVVAEGATALSYQWERSTDGGFTFTPVGGETNDQIFVTVSSSTQDGDQYRCVVTDVAGNVTSDAAVLSVRPTGAFTVSLDQPYLMGTGATGLGTTGVCQATFVGGTAPFTCLGISAGGPAFQIKPNNLGAGQFSLTAVGFSAEGTTDHGFAAIVSIAFVDANGLLATADILVGLLNFPPAGTFTELPAANIAGAGADSATSSGFTYTPFPLGFVAAGGGQNLFASNVSVPPMPDIHLTTGLGNTEPFATFGDISGVAAPAVFYTIIFQSFTDALQVGADRYQIPPLGLCVLTMAGP